MGKYDADVAKYIPGLVDLAVQGMLDDIDTREKAAHPSYKDMEQLDFQVLLTENYYVNPNSIHICFPIKIKQKSDNSTEIDSDLITVNNFFVHFFRQHLGTIMVLKKILRMGAQKTLLQKTYEISTGTDSLNVEFLDSNRQFDWLEISIVPDKSNKQTTIYNSYNRELASQEIKTSKLTNFTEIYSLKKEKKKCNIDNLTQRHLLYKQFVGWDCNGSSVAPLN